MAYILINSFLCFMLILNSSMCFFNLKRNKEKSDIYFERMLITIIILVIFKFVFKGGL